MKPEENRRFAGGRRNLWGRRRTNNISEAFLALRTHCCPFSFLLIAPKCIISAPIRSASTPKVEEDAKTLVGKALKVINHETNVFARD
jgi:hypothetical protein